MKFKNLAYATFVTAAAIAFVIGSAVPSEAAKKKKAAAAPPARPQVICTSPPGPVCATKGDQMFTYNSACWASKDGAKNAKPGACKAAKTAGKKGKKKKG